MVACQKSYWRESLVNDGVHPGQFLSGLMTTFFFESWYKDFSFGYWISTHANSYTSSTRQEHLE